MTTIFPVTADVKQQIQNLPPMLTMVAVGIIHPSAKESPLQVLHRYASDMAYAKEVLCCIYEMLADKDLFDGFAYRTDNNKAPVQHPTNVDPLWAQENHDHWAGEYGRRERMFMQYLANAIVERFNLFEGV